MRVTHLPRHTDYLPEIPCGSRRWSTRINPKNDTCARFNKIKRPLYYPGSYCLTDAQNSQNCMLAKRRLYLSHDTYPDERVKAPSQLLCGFPAEPLRRWWLPGWGSRHACAALHCIVSTPYSGCSTGSRCPRCSCSPGSVPGPSVEVSWRGGTPAVTPGYSVGAMVVSEVRSCPNDNLGTDLQSLSLARRIIIYFMVVT